ncbi:MAG TPA: hypothetical protein VGC42_32615 [Kofleriaceae bacterium]
MIDYEALARRSLDVTPSADERAALRVWADQLEAAGDPRGTLIALEHARDADPARRRALHKAALDHALAHAAALLGPLEPIARVPRALELDWRAGQLYGLRIDLVRCAVVLGREPSDLVAPALDAPITAELRRIELRVAARYPTLAMLEHAASPPPLEEIEVYGGGGPPNRAWTSQLPMIDRMVARYPALRLCVHDGSSNWPLPERSVTAREQLARAAATAEPETPAGRAALGRALLVPEPALRDPALARIEQLGPRAAAFGAILLRRLRVDRTAPKLAIARALVALGPTARFAIPVLAAITGRPAYAAETRSAAGVALAALRALSFPPGP